MSCFSCNTSDNWWIIILLLFLLCNDNCGGCLDCIRSAVCGDNLIWIIALLLLCNTGNSDCGNRNSCNTCGCGCN